MIRRARRGLFRSALAFWIVGTLSIATAVVAAAHQPGPTGTTQDNWVFLNLRGYQSPPANYTVGDTFSFSFDVSNEAATARDLCLTLEVYRLNTLNPQTSYTEAQLENMVQTSNTNETLVTTGTLTKSFAAHQLQTLSMSATIHAAGYYQFDVGLCGTGPFAPRPGFNGPPVSGFVRYLSSSSGTGGITVTPTPTASTAAAHLANTGGGPATTPLLSLLLAIVGLALIGIGFTVRSGAKLRR